MDRDEFISELVPLLKYDSDMEEVYRRIVEYTSDPFEQICIALDVGYYCFY